MRKINLFFAFYFLVIGLLLFYSYTQVDLSLTLSRASVVQTLEKLFQSIGYFNRPVSTYIYCSILISLFGCHLGFLKLTWFGKITRKQFWTFLVLVTIVLTFAYNAFSYDFFNYIFDAKIFTHYHQNPYQHMALDYAPQHEPMLSFMHWTNRTYPYGPAFLGISIVLSYLGLNIFVLSFFIFKVAMGASFLGTVYFLEKIAKKLHPKTALFAIAFFALNPLSLIESLVSAHNDIMMMFFAVMGVYFLLTRKWLWGILAIIVSPLIKQATVFLLIPTIAYFVPQLRKSWFTTEWFLRSCVVFMIFAFLYVINYQREVQPWYFLWILPLVSVLRPNYYINSLTIGFSLGLLLRYVPFLWQGNWDGLAVPIRADVVYIAPIVFFLLALLFRKFSK